MPYRILEHTADAAVEATAPTFPELVAELARGMCALVAGTGLDIGGAEVSLRVEADTVEDLVVDALSELLWRSEVDRLVFGQVTVTEKGPHGLAVTARGTDADAVDLEGAPVKAVTYHDLVVREEPDHWYGRVVFDV